MTPLLTLPSLPRSKASIPWRLLQDPQLSVPSCHKPPPGSYRAAGAELQEPERGANIQLGCPVVSAGTQANALLIQKVRESLLESLLEVDGANPP